jgi:hypothetical protein
MLERARKESSARERGGEALSFQAVALEFDDREVFRSRALVLFGPVRRVEEQRGADLAKEITDVIERDLSELLVEGATWDERMLVIRVAGMFAEDAADRSLEHQNRVGRRIEEARRLLTSTAPADVASMEQRLRAYLERLAREDISDRTVARFARGAPTAVGPDRDRVTRAAATIVTLPLALVAVVLYWLPYQLPRFVTRQLKGDPDVSSTYKLGVGLVVYPLWASAAIAIAFLRLPPLEAAAASAIVLACPFAALPWLDRWDRLAARSRMLAPLEDRRQQVAELAAERSAIMRDLGELRDRTVRSEAAVSA